MLWGGTWGLGSLWGAPPGPGPQEVCDLVERRVLVQMDDSVGNRRFRDMLCNLLLDTGTFGDVAQDVSEAFDVTTAQGIQLDFIGSIVGLARQGFDDIPYRRFLEIQINLLLSAARDDGEWTGTVPNILTICRTFIGPGIPDPVVYTALPPYSFLLTVPGLTVPEAVLLSRFLCKAIYGGVLGQVSVILASDSLWDSDSVGPIANGGIWGSASVVVSPSSTWNLTITIGTQAC